MWSAGSTLDEDGDEFCGLEPAVHFCVFLCGLQAPILKKLAMEFVVWNLEEVEQTPDWKEELIHFPDLKAEIERGQGSNLQ